MEGENENLFTLTPTLSPAYRQAGIKGRVIYDEALKP
jgi:hypothetical protein